MIAAANTVHVGTHCRPGGIMAQPMIDKQPYTCMPSFRHDSTKRRRYSTFSRSAPQTHKQKRTGPKCATRHNLSADVLSKAITAESPHKRQRPRRAATPRNATMRRNAPQRAATPHKSPRNAPQDSRGPTKAKARRNGPHRPKTTQHNATYVLHVWEYGRVRATISPTTIWGALTNTKNF